MEALPAAIQQDSKIHLHVTWRARAWLGHGGHDDMCDSVKAPSCRTSHGSADDPSRLGFDGLSLAWRSIKTVPGTTLSYYLSYPTSIYSTAPPARASGPLLPNPSRCASGSTVDPSPSSSNNLVVEVIILALMHSWLLAYLVVHATCVENYDGHESTSGVSFGAQQRCSLDGARRPSSVTFVHD